MLVKLRAIIDFIIFKGVFIGLCAGAQALLSYFLLSQPPNWHLIISVFHSSFLVYNFSWFLLRLKYASRSGSKCSPILSYEDKILLFTIWLSGLHLCFSLYQLELRVLALFLVLALLSVFYFLPFWRKTLSFRNLTHLKAFIITLIWIASTCLAPFLQTVPSLSYPYPYPSILLARFVYVYILVMLFDVRDIDLDVRQGLTTTAVHLGKTRTTMLCHLLCLVYVCLILSSSLQTTLKLPLLLSIIPLPLVIHFAINQKNPYYFRFLVDAFLLLQPFLIIF